MRKLFGLWIAVLMSCGMLVGAASEARADRRVALVIGLSQYKNPSLNLPNPKNDAEDVAAALRTLGFEVIHKTDLTKRELELTMAQFARAATNADAALFFYAGHALQYQGQNYLMPTDATLEDEISLRYQMMGIDDVRAALERSPGVKIMILDACRNNPIVDQLRRKMSGSARALSLSRGLARIDKTQGMVIAYATSADDVAADGNGRNSPYTAALLKRLQEPGLEVEIMFRRIAADVNAATNGQQRPETSVSLLSEYYINQLDRIAWDKIKDSNDIAAFNDFMRRFPSSMLASLAQSRIQLFDFQKRERVERESAERLAAQQRQEAERARVAAAEKERAEREAAQRRQEEEQRARVAAAEKERAEREAAQRRQDEEQQRARLAAAEKERTEREATQRRQEEEQQRARVAAAEKARAEREAEQRRAEEEKRVRLAGVERLEQEKAAEDQRRRQAAEAERQRREQDIAMKAAPASVSTPTPQSQEQSCQRDAETLTRLRASLARDEVIRFERELGCERLRPQVMRLRESLGIDDKAEVVAQAPQQEPRSRIAVVEPPGAEALANQQPQQNERPKSDANQQRPASPQLAAAPRASQEQACKVDGERLAHLRASPKLDDVVRFERELGCERLRPQVKRLRESLDIEDKAEVPAQVPQQGPRSRIAVIEPPGAEALANQQPQQNERPKSDADQQRSASPQLAAAPRVSQEQACKADGERLTHLRASPKLDDVIRFERELGCERLRPQVKRLRESLDN